MNDQAERLRELYQAFNPKKETKVITIASGKGGVGKSNFALNFALSLIEEGKKVVLIDLDIGMANINVLMGESPAFHLIDMVKERKSIWEVIEMGPGGIEYVSGGAGLDDFMHMNDVEMAHFINEIEKLNDYADIVLIDTGAGLTKESQQCHLSADEIILLTTPEPTALTDAYSIIKMLHHKDDNLTFKLVINRVKSDKEGKEVSDKLKHVAKHFLKKDIQTFGCVAEDDIVKQAVIKQTPFYLLKPNSLASKTIKRLAHNYIHGETMATVKEVRGIKKFINLFSQKVKG